MADMSHCGVAACNCEAVETIHFVNDWICGTGSLALCRAHLDGFMRDHLLKGVVEALERVHAAVRRHFDAQGGHTPSLQAIEALSRPYANGGRYPAASSGERQ